MRKITLLTLVLFLITSCSQETQVDKRNESKSLNREDIINDEYFVLNDAEKVDIYNLKNDEIIYSYKEENNELVYDVIEGLESINISSWEYASKLNKSNEIDDSNVLYTQTEAPIDANFQVYSKKDKSVEKYRISEIFPEVVNYVNVYCYGNSSSKFIVCAEGEKLYIYNKELKQTSKLLDESTSDLYIEKVMIHLDKIVILGREAKTNAKLQMRILNDIGEVLDSSILKAENINELLETDTFVYINDSYNPLKKTSSGVIEGYDFSTNTFFSKKLKTSNTFESSFTRISQDGKYAISMEKIEEKDEKEKVAIRIYDFETMDVIDESEKECENGIGYISIGLDYYFYIEENESSITAELKELR